MKKNLYQEQLNMVDSEFEKNKKDSVIAWVLWIFLGGIGGHRFYLGDTGYAVAMLFLNWLTFGIWGLVDALFINKRIKEINHETEKDIIAKIRNFF